MRRNKLSLIKCLAFHSASGGSVVAWSQIWTTNDGSIGEPFSILLINAICNSSFTFKKKKITNEFCQRVQLDR